jgi:hypothetical protein
LELYQLKPALKYSSREKANLNSKLLTLEHE